MPSSVQARLITIGSESQNALPGLKSVRRARRSRRHRSGRASAASSGAGRARRPAASTPATSLSASWATPCGPVASRWSTERAPSSIASGIAPDSLNWSPWSRSARPWAGGGAQVAIAPARPRTRRARGTHPPPRRSGPPPAAPRRSRSRGTRRRRRTRAARECAPRNVGTVSIGCDRGDRGKAARARCRGRGRSPTCPRRWSCRCAASSRSAGRPRVEPVARQARAWPRPWPDSAALGVDPLVVGALRAQIELVGPVAAKGRVGVAVDQPRDRDPAARRRPARRSACAARTSVGVPTAAIRPATTAIAAGRDVSTRPRSPPAQRRVGPGRRRRPRPGCRAGSSARRQARPYAGMHPAGERRGRVGAEPLDRRRRARAPVVHREKSASGLSARLRGVSTIFTTSSLARMPSVRFSASTARIRPRSADLRDDVGRPRRERAGRSPRCRCRRSSRGRRRFIGRARPGSC